MNSIPVEVVDVEKNENDRKTFFSQWHVLVSSNVKTYDIGTANQIADDLKSAVRYAFESNGSQVFRVMREGDSFDSDSIEKIKISYAAEIGEDPKGGRVHIHAIIEVEHHTILQINIPVAVKIIKEQLKSNPFILGAYVNIKWVPTSKPLEHYIGKNPLSKAGSSFPSLHSEKKKE